MKVTIANDASLRELAEILVKVRYHTRQWEKYYGADTRKRKKLWEQRADEWIEKHVKEEQ